MNASFTQWDLALAARALKFAKSVPLRLGVTRVPRTCYGFVSVGWGATTRLVLSSAANLHPVQITYLSGLGAGDRGP